MTGTKILWGQMLGALAMVLLGCWAATEWTAWRLGFQPALGLPWVRIGAAPVYPPQLFFAWWYHFDAYAPGVFAKGAAIASAGGLGAALLAIVASVLRARQARHVTTYGSAHWATRHDIEAAGLFGDAGVQLGRLGAQTLRHDGPEHVLCFAPTRSGKGVGLVVPTLLSWTGSVIVHDIKGENWTLTAGWRAQFSHCLLFDPTNPRSAAYNPLLEVRRGEWEVRDVQNIADVLVDPEGALERRNHWEKTSHSLLVGAILHVLYAEPDKTLAGVAAFLSDPARPIERTLARDDDHAASRRARRPSGGRAVGPRAAEQVGERALRRAQHGDVVSRPLPRSGGGQGDVALATGGSPIWSVPSGRCRSTSSCRRRTSRARSR